MSSEKEILEILKKGDDEVVGCCLKVGEIEYHDVRIHGIG